MKYGLPELLPERITLLHGPGCPVCVTPAGKIDAAVKIASQPDIVLCSYGDMLRVPGTSRDLLSVRAQGADIRAVYSPMDALELAQEDLHKQVVFFAVGFETTAPANAMTVYHARKSGIRNFSLIVSQIRLPPVLELLLSSQKSNIQGFLAAGHVCTVMGYTEYEPISEKYEVPIIVTGFEPADILQGIYMCVKQLKNRINMVENQYSRSVRKRGNDHAKTMMKRVFKITDMAWRGIGTISGGGLALKNEYVEFDAEKRFATILGESDGSTDIARNDDTDFRCISNLILLGIKQPDECPLFGTDCTVEHPLGSTMVSGEGACSAYYRYRKK
jgi:hydrogenase expression/formation protein HypD